uniref:Leucine-rich repeat-containing N-terminal plant-type domain-containing protein n=1 Tax=Leersia perrieri TaxID=77586 RepID=A0A0D9XT98_9ORYZ
MWFGLCLRNMGANMHYMDNYYTDYDQTALIGGISHKCPLLNLPRLEHLNLMFFSVECFLSLVINLTNLHCLDLSTKVLTMNSTHLSWLPYWCSLTYLDISRTNLSMVYDWTEVMNNIPLSCNM